MERIKRLSLTLISVATLTLMFAAGTWVEHKRGCLSNEVPVVDYREYFKQE